MARKSSTDFNKSSQKPRDEKSFNPFQEAKKIIDFSQQAGGAGYEKFTVIVTSGILEWTGVILDNKVEGFIAVIDRAEFATGLTSPAWRKIEEKIAKEMCRQRKAW